MDNTKIETKKTAIEQKFGELKSTKVQLVGQAQALAKAVNLIDGEIRESQGAYKTVCELLELDPIKESERVEKEWQAAQKSKAEEKKPEEGKK